MARLVLIRHSQTLIKPEVSSHAWTLTEEGLSRCDRLACALAGMAITGIVTSHEKKAVLTGGRVSAHLRVPVASAPGLGETRRDTLPFYEDAAAFRAMIRRGFDEPDQLVVGEERFSDALCRFSAAITGLVAEHPSERLGVVTHGTVLSLYLSHLTGTAAYGIWRGLGLPAYVTVDTERRTMQPIVNVE